jgi:hypothetical protein
VNCFADLQGETIDLPEGTRVEWHGGQVVNGGLNFTQVGRIDANLLNLNLTVTGGNLFRWANATRNPPYEEPNDVRLMSTSANFCPERWDIVQGEAGNTSDVALANLAHIRQAVDIMTELGVAKVYMGSMDVFMRVDLSTHNDKIQRSARSIRLPHNFHLAMANDTVLRVLPNLRASYTLITALLTENVTVTGGHLIGDRYTHDYAGGNRSHDLGAQDLGHGIGSYGCINCLFEGVVAEKFIGDGLVISSLTMRKAGGSPSTTPYHYMGYIPAFAQNNTVRGCTFRDNRRNGFAFTDGHDLIAEAGRRQWRWW